MGLSAKVGTFTTATGTAPFDQAITGLGFTPKLLVLWLNNFGSSVESTTAYFCLGFAASSSQRGYNAVSHSTATATPDTGTGRIYSITKCIGLVTPGAVPAILWEADLKSLDSDGFTVTYSVNPAAGYLVNYLALGGTDIANVFVGSLTTRTSTGTTAVTAPGFPPDALLFLANNSALAATAQTNYAQGIGWATRVDGGYGAISSSVNALANPTQAARLQRNDRCLSLLAVTGASVTKQATISSWDATGFTLNYDVCDATGRVLIYAAIQGGNWRAGSFTQPTSAQTQNIDTAGGAASAVLLMSDVDTAIDGTITDHARHAFGGASATTQRGAIWNGVSDNVSTTVARGRLDQSRALVLNTEVSGGSELARADYNGSLPTGFQLDWEAADGTARKGLWLAVSTTSPTADGSIAADSTLAAAAELDTAGSVAADSAATASAAELDTAGSIAADSEAAASAAELDTAGSVAADSEAAASAELDVAGGVAADSEAAAGAAEVQTGGGIAADAEASVSAAELDTAGSIAADSEAAAGGLELDAGGGIDGDAAATASAELHLGGSIEADSELVATAQTIGARRTRVLTMGIGAF